MHDTITHQKLPKGIGNAYAFTIFNAMSFNMVMGTPMLLYFKKLDASATIISLVAAMVYILNVFQIPAAHFVEKIGYKTFVLRGWTARTFLIIFMVLVTIIPPWMDNATRIGLMLLLLFSYNTSRGISLCGFLPWITQLVPENIRGRYISRDQMFVSITTVFIMGMTAIFLKHFHHPWHFSYIFMYGFIMGITSLFFLKKIPDVTTPAQTQSHEPIPWKSILTHKPFLKLLAFNFIVSSAVSTGGVFYLPYLKDYFHVSDYFILMLNVATGSIGMVALYFFGKKIDHIGNRPFLVLGILLLMLHYFIWSSLCAKLILFNPTIIVFLQMTTGLGFSFYNMANMRMAMAIVPPMGRSHFFALFSVTNSLTMGITPILWGLAIDAVGTWNLQIGSWNLNPYTLLFSSLTLTMIGALLSLTDLLKDAPSMTTEEFMRQLLIKSPVSIISRLWKRRPPSAPEL